MGKSKKLPEPTDKGILILAMDHHYYGRMAFNLAVSLKTAEPEIQICLAYAGNALADLFRYDITKYFDKIVEIPDKYRMRRGHTENIHAKLHITDLSPFQSTLYLDADIIWLPSRKPSELMKELAKVPLAIQNHGCMDIGKGRTERLENFFWASPAEIKQAYNLTSGKLFALFSEAMWIQKTEANEDLFRKARELAGDLMVNYTEFAGGIPDELPLSIAMAITGTYPHKPGWRPIYWEHMEKLQLYNNRPAMEMEYYGLSTGGKVTPQGVKAHYNYLADYCFQKEGLRYPYHVINKKDFLPERKKI